MIKKAKGGDWELYQRAQYNMPWLLDAVLTGSKDQPIEDVLIEAEKIYVAKCQRTIKSL
jgi:hypothetical protein